MAYGKITENELNPELLKLIQAGGNGGNTVGISRIVVHRNESVISTDQNSINIGIPQYVKDRDVLFVFKNTTYLSPNEYTISEDSNSIIKVGSDSWTGSIDNITFEFIVFENSPNSGGDYIPIPPNGGGGETIIAQPTKVIFLTNKVKLINNTREINIGIPGYNKKNDSLMVFKNSTFLSPGEYTIDENSTKISKVEPGNWIGTGDASTFEFIVLKNVPLSETGELGGITLNDVRKILDDTNIRITDIKNNFNGSTLDKALEELYQMIISKSENLDLDEVKKLLTDTNVKISDKQSKFTGENLETVLDELHTLASSNKGMNQEDIVKLLTDNNIKISDLKNHFTGTRLESVLDELFDLASADKGLNEQAVKKLLTDTNVKISDKQSKFTGENLETVLDELHTLASSNKGVSSDEIMPLLMDTNIKIKDTDRQFTGETLDKVLSELYLLASLNSEAGGGSGLTSEQILSLLTDKNVKISDNNTHFEGTTLELVLDELYTLASNNPEPGLNEQAVKNLITDTNVKISDKQSKFTGENLETVLDELHTLASDKPKPGLDEEAVRTLIIDKNVKISDEQNHFRGIELKTVLDELYTLASADKGLNEQAVKNLITDTNVKISDKQNKFTGENLETVLDELYTLASSKSETGLNEEAVKLLLTDGNIKISDDSNYFTGTDLKSVLNELYLATYSNKTRISEINSNINSAVSKLNTINNEIDQTLGTL